MKIKPIEFNPDSKLLLKNRKDKKKFDHRQPFRILCLDGGGVRGVLTSIILQRIIRAHPRFLEEVDLICGTSTGGLLALLLSAGYNPRDITDLYTAGAPHIFQQDPWRLINPFSAKYDDTNKKEIFQYYLGNRTMNDLTKQCAVIAFRLDGRPSKTIGMFSKREGWRPAIFSNLPSVDGKIMPDLSLLAWEAAMRTSAAPTYFPVYNSYADGGLIANNPAMLAYSMALTHFPDLPSRNISLLSIGSGYYPRHSVVLQSVSNKKDIPLHFEGQEYSGESALKYSDWGIRQWIPFMLDLLLDGDSITTELVLENILNDSMYHRFDPRLEEPCPLDDVTTMKRLSDFAWTLDITKTLKFIDDRFLYDVEKGVDSDVHNSLDISQNYHDAWLRNAPKISLATN